MSFRAQDYTINSENRSERQWGYYVQLFWRKAWFVIPSFLIISVGWFLVIVIFGMTKPRLEATAILQFEDPSTISAVEKQVGIQTNAKAVLIRSRSFLEEIAKQLSLQLQTENYSRSQIFDSLWVGKDVPEGFYQMKISGDKFNLSYSDSEGKIQNKILHSGSLASMELYSTKNLYFRFAKEYREKPFTFKFSVVRLRDAVDFIADHIIIKFTGKDESIMSVSLPGSDYELITLIVNAIADNFVNENSVTGLDRQSGVLQVLEKQLETAKAEMLSAEATLRKFRNANPTVGLQDAFSPPVKIVDLKESEAQLRAGRLEGIALEKRYFSIDDSSRIEMLNEMISYLNKYETATAAALENELNTLADEARRLRDEYSPKHPLVSKNATNVKQLGVKVNAALNDLLKELARKIGENNSQIDQIQSEIARLPSKEIELANLQRKYDVTSQVYSNVLTRYNEAKIAKAVALGDVHVIDHAVVPEQKIDFKSLIAFMGIGIFLGFCVGFGPVVVLDFFDRTAKTENDLRRLTDIRLLESIPVKGTWNSDKKAIASKLMSGKLISSDYSQSFVDETYRSLRAKILLSLHNVKSKRILVTSLNMGEGKSFTSANIAISMAQQQIPTLLIDGDLRRGVLHNYFNISKTPGLSELLCTKDVSENKISPALQTTDIQNLSVMTSGQIMPQSTELLNSGHFRQLLYNLSKSFEMIIFDTPPIAVVSDAVGIQDAFEKYLLIVRASHTNISELNRKIKEYPGLYSRILGIVFNGAPYRRTEYYQYSNYKY